MIKDIKYSGYAAQPSDYECPDGQLAVAVNCIPEDSSLRPVAPPSLHLKCGARCVLIHKIDSEAIYIFDDDQSGTLLWLRASDIPADRNPAPALFHAIDGFSLSGQTIHQYSAIGYIVLVASSDGIHYIRYDADTASYLYLGNHLPEIAIDFALGTTGMRPVADSEFSFTVEKGSDEEKFIERVLNLVPPHYGGWGHDSTIDPGKAVANAILGPVNKYIAGQTANGHFLQPFFVRCAYRLFDGSNVMASAPVLMIPNSGEPVVGAQSSSDSDGVRTIVNYIHYSPADLFYRILSDISVISPWRDIITDIDIFVSPQVFTFNPDGEISAYSRLEENIFTHIGTFTHAPAATAATASDGDDASDADESERRPGTIVEGKDTLYSCTGNFEQQPSATAPRFWHLPAKDAKDIESAITEISSFHRIASIPFDDIAQMEYFRKVDIKDKALSTLTSRPRLEEEVYTHDHLVARSLFPYNARLSAASLTLTPFSGFPLRTMTQFSYKGGEDGASEFVEYSLYVRVSHNGLSQWVRTSGSPLSTIGSPLSTDSYDSLPCQFPRWLFYPDSAATELIIADADGYYRLPLTRHDFITGAYWFRGLGSDVPQKTDGPVPSDVLASVQAPKNIPMRNRVCVSEVNNPFLFPPSGFVQVGNASILAISSAARALSQGQFGSFPLYAFTDEGVWALSVSDKGTYSARQPITRDVCVNADGITQLDSAVLFPTDRGIMLISGSQTQCISEPLNSEFPFDVRDLPGFAKLHGMIHEGEDTCLPTLPFSQFLRDCRMIYDYVHQRIIAYSPKVTYAYVYSMKSQQWGMTFSNILSHLNSYPEALAVDRDINIVSFRDSPADRVGMLYVTRPLKLGQGSMLKTVDTVIQRGNFARGQVATVLYGSRDLIHWFLVWSSKDHYLRGFRGTPYKYFRIACVTSLAKGESIFGASLQFNPRQTDQPR